MNPTPHSQYDGKNKINVPNHQPDLMTIGHRKSLLWLTLTKFLTESEENNSLDLLPVNITSSNNVSRISYLIMYTILLCVFCIREALMAFAQTWGIIIPACHSQIFWIFAINLYNYPNYLRCKQTLKPFKTIAGLIDTFNSTSWYLI